MWTGGLPTKTGYLTYLGSPTLQGGGGPQVGEVYNSPVHIISFFNLITFT